MVQHERDAKSCLATKTSTATSVILGAVTVQETQPSSSRPAYLSNNLQDDDEEAEAVEASTTMMVEAIALEESSHMQSPWKNLRRQQLKFIYNLIQSR